MPAAAVIPAPIGYIKVVAVEKPIKDKNENEAIYEAADITYHVLVALASLNINPDRVKQELARRFEISGIEEKNSRNR